MNAPLHQRPASLVSINGWYLLFHGIPTSQLGANAIALSPAQVEALLETAGKSDCLPFDTENVRRRLGAPTKPTRPAPSEPATIRDAPPSALPFGRTHKPRSGLYSDTPAAATAHLLQCSVQAAQRELHAGTVTAISWSPIVASSSSGEQGSVGAKMQSAWRQYWEAILRVHRRRQFRRLFNRLGYTPQQGFPGQ